MIDPKGQEGGRGESGTSTSEKCCAAALSSCILLLENHGADHGLISCGPKARGWGL